MIRASLCILLVVASGLFAVPTVSQTRQFATPRTIFSLNPYRIDPNGTLYAFNSTVSDFDLYTHANATIGGNDGNVTWFSALNSTVSGQPIPETGFHFNLTGPSIRESVNYTVNIPKGAGIITYLRFQWNGTVGPGTGARFLVLNSTSNTNTDPAKIVSPSPVIRPSNLTGTFFGSNSSSSTGGVPLSCGRTEECFEVTRYVGFNLTLMFLFNSTSIASSSTGRLRVTVSNVEVASIGTLTPAVSHSLTVNSGDPTEIDHDGRLLVTFNSTITLPKPNSNQSLTHLWNTVLLSFYLPKTYRSVNITLGTTRIDNSTSPSGFFATHGFAQGTCSSQGIVQCTGSIFFSVNATGFEEGIGRTVLVKALSNNALTSIATALGGVDTDFWTPGDNMTVRVTNSPGVNVTGSQFALLEPTPNPSGIIPSNVTLSTTARAGSANYTIAIPSSQLGNWVLTLTFANGFDYGSKMHDITIDEIQVDPGLVASGGVGASTSINVAGKLSYLSDSSSPARNANVTIFAIGPGTGTSLLARSATPASGLYISNITTVVGVGSPRQPVIMYFSIVNPNATQAIQFDANITIDHEWYPGETHGVNVTIPLTPANIDNGNNFLNPITYSLQAILTPSGVQLTLQSLTTKAQLTVKMTPGIGASAVPSLRQHFGYFKITLHAKNNATNTLETPLPIESAPYAYLLYTPTLPSQLLAYSTTVTPSPDGSFSTSLASNQLLGVKKLQVIVLARDVNGIVLGDASRDPAVFSDSSVLQPTADSPSSVAVQQTVTTTLHLKSNSTSLVTSLTVNLDITGSTTVPTQTSSVTIQPRATADVKFTFTAPSSAGKYAITFSSPQYGGTGQPLLSKTLVVSIVSSDLQIIIVVALGLVAAAVIVSVYVRGRRPSAETETSEKTRPKTTGSPKPKPEGQSRNP